MMCLLTGHEPIRERAQDKPDTIRWRCLRCGRVVGETSLPRSAKLMAALKRNSRRWALRLVASAAAEARGNEDR